MILIKKKLNLFSLPIKVTFEKLETGVVIETHRFKDKTKIIVRTCN